MKIVHFIFEGIAVLEKLCQLKVHLEVPDIVEEQSKVIFLIFNQVKCKV